MPSWTDSKKIWMYAQVDAVDQLHDQIVETVAVAKIVDRNHIRVVQLRQGARFTGEALGKRDVVTQGWVEHLDGNGPLELPVKPKLLPSEEEGLRALGYLD